MKLKRILSSALVIVMLFTALLVAIPTTADAAYTQTAATTSYTLDEIKKILSDTKAQTGVLYYNFNTAEEMLNYELEKGYLDSVTTSDGRYAMYVNRYSGVFYYQNKLTGQIITSNPSNPAYKYEGSLNPEVSEANRAELMSQISISYQENSKGTDEVPLNSTQWSAMYAQISTKFINNGIRVNYVLGDTTTRFLLPGRILAKDYEEMVLVPMLERFEAIMIEVFNKIPDDVKNDSANAKLFNGVTAEFFNSDVYTPYAYGCLESVSGYGGYKDYLNAMYAIFNNTKFKEYVGDAKETLDTLRKDINSLSTKYQLTNPLRLEAEGRQDSKPYKEMISTYYPEELASTLDICNPKSEDYHAPMYVYSKTSANDKRNDSRLLAKYVGGYTYAQMFAHEKECGYVDNTPQSPVFRCALEYSFNEDGTVSIRLPANSISFDESTYTLTAISPLKYFGAGHLKEDGYIFFPDGSGTIVEFEDFGDFPITINNATIYGSDYCYSNLAGNEAHREHITMPVYGVVSSVNANATSAAKAGGVTKVTNGYFAVLEEGASLAKLSYIAGYNCDFASAYANYTPYPSDRYDLSEQISVGSSTTYTMVSDSRYNGSYVTKIVMLTDDVLGAAAYSDGKYYSASYVGMANYYRDYLIAKGALKTLQSVSEDLPLYIEALGAMEITTKFLSFPVQTNIPLTTFEDIKVMYNQLSNNKQTFLDRAAEYDKLAEETIDEVLKQNYIDQAALYRKYAEDAESITNINVRLTGFTNGGMHSTYPTRLRWENACGGKSGFTKLVEEAKAISSEAGVNFGIYPDFDFMYINNTALFDGISNRGNVSRMVDNRYASKQLYSSILQEYVSYFTLVINPASLERFYTGFVDNYISHGANAISVSTLGSDLNSNFDEDESINRADAEKYVVSVLKSMKEDKKLDVMVDNGNSYTYEYVSHILNASIDSSHFIYSSYSIPFTGMVLHGYVNYSGTPLNYAGTPTYNILRSIENGAAPYYVLCYRNSNYLKDDELLNEYYGVSYETWFDSIIESYTILNNEIGDLQNYQIVDHKILIGERVIDSKEVDANDLLVKNEIVELLDKSIAKYVDEGFKYLQANAGTLGYSVPLKVVIDENSVFDQIAKILGQNRATFMADETNASLIKNVRAVIEKYTAEYSSSDANAYAVNVTSFEYESVYNFSTDSLATDSDYKYTDFTSDINNIVMVTYSNGSNKVRFILNYNIYSVTVKLAEGETYNLGKYSWIRLD